MPACLKFKQCLRRVVHWPGILEACLHCVYTGFFVIEAATYGLILEQKFHGILQIVLINFYLVLLCLVFIRWNMDINSVVCQLLVSLLSFLLTIFVGKLIMLYIDYMERPRKPWKDDENGLIPRLNHSSPASDSAADDVERNPRKIPADIMKLDPLIVILDICVYLLISISYIVMLLKISLKLRNHSKIMLLQESTRAHPETFRSPMPSFYGIDSSDSSIMTIT